MRGCLETPADDNFTGNARAECEEGRQALDPKAANEGGEPGRGGYGRRESPVPVLPGQRGSRKRIDVL